MYLIIVPFSLSDNNMCPHTFCVSFHIIGPLRVHRTSDIRNSHRFSISSMIFMSVLYSSDVHPFLIQHMCTFLQIQLSKKKKTPHKFQVVYCPPTLISSSYTERKSACSRYIEKYHHPKYFLPSIFSITKSFLNGVQTTILSMDVRTHFFPAVSNRSSRSRYTNQNGGHCDSKFVRTFGASILFTDEMSVGEQSIRGEVNSLPFLLCFFDDFFNSLNFRCSPPFIHD